MIYFAIYIFQANIDQDEDFGAACEKTTELGANNASGNNIWKETILVLRNVNAHSHL